MSTSTWTGAVNSDWDDADNWSPAGVPGADSDVTIATGAPVASAPIGTVNSITDSFDLSFESAGTNTVATFLDDAGHLRVDANGGEGGTILNVGGALTDSGHLHIGNATLSASDEVTAAALDNTGRIHLTGSSADQALLDVSGSAGFGTAGVLSGYARLAGDSAIEFASGEITSLAANAQLHLNGNDAFIEDGAAPGSNSALTGLASIGAGAILGLHNKASVSTSGSLANDGDIRLDIVGGSGGSSLTLAGALTNSGTLQIGNATLSASDEVKAASLDNTGYISLTGRSSGLPGSPNQALLDVTTGNAGFGTAGVLSGSVALANDSAIEFAGGQITSLAAGALLSLDWNDAFIEDSTALGSNSALTELASIGAGATFELNGYAAVSTTGALTNSGLVNIGAAGAGSATGGGALSIGGALTNTGRLNIFGSASVTAKSFVNSGIVTLTGNGSAFASLNVSGALTNNGSISIGGDTEELAGAVDGTGSFSLAGGGTSPGGGSSLQFDSSVSAGQTISETGTNESLTLNEAQSFAATISGFGTGDTIDATNFHAPPATTYNFVENIAGTGGTLTLTDASQSLTATIHMTGDYSKSSFALAPDHGTGTLVKFV